MVELRKRKARVSYAIYAPPSDDEAPEGSSSTPKLAAGPESDGSGSDFSAEMEKEVEEESSPDDLSAAEEEEEEEEESPPSEAGGDSGSDIVGGRKRVPMALGFSSTSRLTALPNAQRQATSEKRRAQLTALQVGGKILFEPRAMYTPPNRMKLKRKPRLFGESDSSLTVPNTDTRDTVHDWSQIISPGPIWQLVENKAWYKDCATADESMDVDQPPSPSKTWKGKGKQVETPPQKPGRPLVYRTVTLDMETVAIRPRASEVLLYLPSEVPADEASPETVPGVPCYFGPHDAQEKQIFEMFDSQPMENFIKGSKSHVFSAGGPVWTLDWCPIADDSSPQRSCKQYLAVAPFPSKEYTPTIGARMDRPAAACIQIWSLGPKNPKDEVGEVTCEMVLCIDSGPAHMLRWCPLPSHDPWSAKSSPKKLGILAGAFADGLITFWVVPDPDHMRNLAGKGVAVSEPVFVHLKEPLLRIELENTPFWSLDWANSEVVAAGCTNGSIAVYHIKDHLTGQSSDPLLPSVFQRAHQAAIRSITWLKIPPTDAQGQIQPSWDPTVVCSVGYDGSIICTDTRELVPIPLARYRDVIHAVTFAPWAGGPVATEYDTVKWYDMRPQVFGRGHHTMLVGGPVWGLSVSDYHPFIASAASDGSLQIVNMMRTTRKNYHIVRMIYKIYQMDYNRKTGEHRMLERFLPTDRFSLRSSALGGKKVPGKPKKRRTAEEEEKIAATWSREVSVHCVAWNNGNGLSKCQLLASATASGLVRIDNLWGWYPKDGPEEDLDGDAMDED